MTDTMMEWSEARLGNLQQSRAICATIYVAAARAGDEGSKVFTVLAIKHIFSFSWGGGFRRRLIRGCKGCIDGVDLLPPPHPKYMM